MGKGFYRKAAVPIGPGGWKCHCCGPAPGKLKKIHKRHSKKIFSSLIDKIVRQELLME